MLKSGSGPCGVVKILVHIAVPTGNSKPSAATPRTFSGPLPTLIGFPTMLGSEPNTSRHT